MKTASSETRALVVKAYTSGVATRKQLAEIFGYHIQSIGNWICEFKREGRVAPRPKGHRNSVFSGEEKKAVLELLQSEDIKKALTAWSLWQRKVDINSLAFIDESCARRICVSSMAVPNAERGVTVRPRRHGRRQP
ncbi:MAG: helix-turn-helix domain-containing protein [Desulfovibrio sp.]|jgi:transposase|nr:helix-turn-helix domain-containing protein [Desulfovibrio sp.]